MTKKAFLDVLAFMKSKLWLILGMIAAMLLLTFGEQALSDVLVEAELVAADVVLGMIRLVLQTALSTVLILFWYRDRGRAAPFAAVDILKLFVATLLTTLLEVICVMSVVLLPLGVWLFLRWDFYMNVYITGRSNGVFSCIGESFRATKGHAAKYLVCNVKYLLVYFLVELAVAVVTAYAKITDATLSGGVQIAVDILYPVFVSVLMPYRYLLKCGFYDAVLKEDD